jgi:hypothetical protein
MQALVSFEKEGLNVDMTIDYLNVIASTPTVIYNPFACGTIRIDHDQHK